MSRLLAILAALALTAAAVQPATATPVIADDDVAITAADAVFGVLQQGKGQGGGQGGGNQEARGGRGQGGGGGEARGGGRGQGGGGGQARESRGRGQGGGGSDARPSRGSGSGGGQPARGSGQGSGRSGGGNSGSSASDNRGGGRSSGDARESRGNSGNASSRSDDRPSNASSAASERGNSSAAADRPSGSSVRGRGRLSDDDLRTRINALPPAQRRLANSSRLSERMAVGAIARGHARGLAADAFDVRSDNDRVRILNRRGDLLFDMDDRRAGELGGWRLRRLGDQAPRANAPAFCRSGQGHPVWGREWCIEKGFGLGSRAGTLWSRGGLGDIIFRNPDYRTRLDRGGLLGVLGDIVLGRLALQSVALGYDEPLTGYWVADPSGPYILRVNSGPYEVAEFYDRDRDNRVEVLYVVQPVW